MSHVITTKKNEALQLNNEYLNNPKLSLFQPAEACDYDAIKNFAHAVLEDAFGVCADQLRQLAYREAAGDSNAIKLMRILTDIVDGPCDYNKDDPWGGYNDALLTMTSAATAKSSQIVPLLNALGIDVGGGYGCG